MKKRIPATEDGHTALAAVAATSAQTHSLRHTAPRTAGAGAELRATTLIGDLLPLSVPRAWCDVVNGPTVWLLQLAHDRNAEGHGLYSVAQRCPPNSKNEKVSALRPGALLPMSAREPQPHLQLL